VNAKLAIRDRLRRESKLNAELLDKINVKKNIISELTTNALQEVFEMPIPLNKVLDKSLDENVKKILCKNKNYKNWTENIHTESELVERLWQRTKMLEIHVKINQGKPNVNYVISDNYNYRPTTIRIAVSELRLDDPVFRKLNKEDTG
jgi:hypothetical protein